VVITPGFGKRVRHFGVLSRYLTRHGLRTLRFDFTNHVGASDGEIRDLTLSSMVNDLDAVIASVKRRSREQPIYVVAPSLSGRVASRVLAERQRVDAAVFVMPVVDVEATLLRVTGRNLVEEWRSGAVRNPDQTARVTNHEIRYEFVRDALELEFVGLDATARELASIPSSITTIAAEQDDWVHVGELRHALETHTREARGSRSLVVLESLTHEPVHNPPAMRLLFEQLLATFCPNLGSVQHLEFEEVLETVDAERKWARATAEPALTNQGA
jgi:alpha-beta hydrolase superfamily lysophospholipase